MFNRFRGYRSAIGLVLFGAFVAGAVFYLLYQNEQSRVRSTFQSTVDRYHTLATYQIQRQSRLGGILRQFFMSSRNVTSDEFHQFASHLHNRHPGELQVVFWMNATNVSNGATDRTSESGDGMMIHVADGRSYQVHLTYQYPENIKLFDVEKGWHRAGGIREEMEAAVRKRAGELARMSLQDTASEAGTGFHYFAPVTRETASTGETVQLLGFVGLSGHVRNILGPVFGQNAELNVRVRSKNERDAEPFLTFTTPGQTGNTFSTAGMMSWLSPGLGETRTLRVDDHSWHLTYTAGPKILRQYNVWYAPVGAFMAFFIFFILAAYVWFLRQQQRRVEKLVDERTDKLNKARERAEAANQAKSEFLARMSHDIRTPLNSVLGMTTMLEKTALDRQQKTYVQSLKHASDVLVNLINDIQDLSNLEAGELHLNETTFELEPLVMDVVSYYARRAHDRGLELSVYFAPNCPTAVVGDQDRVQQVLVNLLSNALKYTETGEVIVRVRPVEDDSASGRLRFEVEDTGLGVPDDKQDRIFQRFTRADDEAPTDDQGTGLGLTICKHLVECMGGEISVESEEGSGSRFEFTVPFDLPDSGPGDSYSTLGIDRQQQEAMDLEGLRVLVIDDLETNREIIGSFLRSLGAEVSEACDEYEALEQVNLDRDTEPFDVIFLDCNVRETDGFQVAEELQETVSVDRILMMLTSDNLGTDRHRVRKQGIGDYLVKPVTRSVLLDAIRRIRDEEEPADEEDEGTSPELPDWADLDRPPRVLVAEDNEHNRKLMKAIMQQYPVQLDFAEDGDIAVKMVRSGLFDLVFMDVRMPGMTGLEATRRIREWEQEHGVDHIPIIALTAQALEEHRQESLEAGCDEHLSKPVRENMLIRTIRQYLIQEPSDEDVPEEDQSESSTTPSPDGPETEGGNQAVEVRIDERFRNIVPDFLDTLQQEITRIEEMIDRDNLEDVPDIGHELKGSAASLGFETIQTLSQEIEDAARERDTEELQTLLDRLSHRLHHLQVSYV